MTLLGSLLSFIYSHPYFSPFISGLIQEEVLILTTIISGESSIPFYIIFFFGFLGILIGDIFWFLFIKIKPLLFFAKKIGKARKKIVSKTRINNFPPPTNLKSFIFLKFIYGLRSWAIFYCSVHKMPLKKFILNASIATAIWLIIMIPLAKIIGKFFYYIFDVTKDVGIIIMLIIAMLIIWSIVTRFIIKKFFK